MSNNFSVKIFNEINDELFNNWTFLEKLQVYKLLINRNWINLFSYFKEVLLKQKNGAKKFLIGISG